MFSYSRRTMLKAGAAFTGASALGFPAIVRAEATTIKIGHLTPLTGFLGAIGSYAQLGVKLAAEEINQSGGIMGKPLDLMSEDSVNPATAATKAQRMLEQDGAAVLVGEISSASSLTIMQVAERNKKVFFSTGARSDALRGKSCNRYSFHCDIPNTVMVNAVGTALRQQGMVKGKKFFTLTADYIFGHDLLKAAKSFFDANGANLIGDELIATDVTDFSPYLLKVRQAKPDVVCCNLAGNQVTNLVKQYAEFGFPYPLVGFTYFDFYQCIKNNPSDFVSGNNLPYIFSYLQFQYSDANAAAIMNANGFVNISSSSLSVWYNAVVTLLTSGTSAMNFAGTGACSAVSPGA